MEGKRVLLKIRLEKGEVEKEAAILNNPPGKSTSDEDNGNGRSGHGAAGRAQRTPVQAGKEAGKIRVARASARASALPRAPTLRDVVHVGQVVAREAVAARALSTISPFPQPGQKSSMAARLGVPSACGSTAPVFPAPPWSRPAPRQPTTNNHAAPFRPPGRQGGPAPSSSSLIGPRVDRREPALRPSDPGARGPASYPGGGRGADGP